MHLVGLLVFVPEPLPLFVAKQLPPDVLGDQLYLVVDGAVARHFAFVAVIPDRPPRDADCSPLPEILHKVGVERRIQNH